MIRDKGKALKWGVFEALGAQLSSLAAIRKAGRTLTAPGCLYAQPTGQHLTELGTGQFIHPINLLEVTSDEKKFNQICSPS